MDMPLAAWGIWILPGDLCRMPYHPLTFCSADRPDLHPAPAPAFVGHYDWAGLPDETVPVCSVRLERLA